MACVSAVSSQDRYVVPRTWMAGVLSWHGTVRYLTNRLNASFRGLA
jgi:hypothetical protein